MKKTFKLKKKILMAKACYKDETLMDRYLPPSSALELCAPRTQLLACPDAEQPLHGQKTVPTQKQVGKQDPRFVRPIPCRPCPANHHLQGSPHTHISESDCNGKSWHS